MTLSRPSPCKVNLLLNVLGRRPDGFHELETVMQPVGVTDTLGFSRRAAGLTLSCSEPSLPTDAGNLVYRAAKAFLEAAAITDGVALHLEKRVPLAAGLGGGSSNAAATLLGLNDLFDRPLTLAALEKLAASLGSDVPFFLQANPALATGRGEKVESLPPFAALQGATILLIHPGFGIATPWAYRELARFPEALNRRPGRARELTQLLASGDLRRAGAAFYNSLEAPALHKYPILAMYQEFLREHGAAATLMSGSGSTTFALFESRATAEAARDKFLPQFGEACWTAVVPASPAA